MLKFIKRHIWIIFSIILLVLFPQSLSDQAKLNMRVIIIGIGVDYFNDKYQVTAQVVMPTNQNEGSSINAQIKYVNTEGDTISDAVQKISYRIGKTAELSHIEFIVVGQTMQPFNLASSLNYFYRNFKLKNSLMLLSCEGDARDTLHKTSTLELSVALDLQKIYITNESQLNGVATTYVEFVNKSNAISKTCVLDTLELVDQTEESSSIVESNSSSGGSDSGGSSGGEGSGGSDSGGSDSGGEGSGGGSGSSSSSQSSGGGSSQQSEKNIQTLSPLHLYRNGTFVGKVTDPEQVIGYYFAHKKSKSGNVYVTDFTYGEAQDVNFNFRIDNMSKFNSVKFENGKPVHTLSINIKRAILDELSSKFTNNIKLYNNLEENLQKELLKQAEKTIKGYINKLFEYCQQNNFDIFNTADLANKFANNEWNQYYQSLQDKNQYMQDVTFVVKINFSSLT